MWRTSRGNHEERDALRGNDIAQGIAGETQVAEMCNCVRRCQLPPLRHACGQKVSENERVRCGSGKLFVDDHQRKRAIRRAQSREGSHLVRVQTRCGHTDIAKTRFVPVVVAVQLHCFVSRGGGVWRRPTRCQIQSFAAEDAEDIGLGGCAVDVVLRAPVVFGEAGFGAGIIGRHPAFQPRNQLHDAADPTGIHIIGVPERAGRTVAQELHGGGDIGPELITLRIIVDGEIIEQTLVGIRRALAELVEQPGQIIPAAIRRPVGKIRGIVIGVRAGPLLIVTAVEVAGPAPFFRGQSKRSRINRFDLRRIIEKLIANLLHRRAHGMHVPVRRVPDGVLVVHEIIAHAAVGG